MFNAEERQTMTSREAYEQLHEARQMIHRVAQAFSGHEIACAEFDVSRAIDTLRGKIEDLTSVPVSVAILRAGDLVAIGRGDVPNLRIAVAEYAPVGGVIAFRVGWEREDGSVYFMPRETRWSRSGTYSWGDTFYASPADAEVIRARVDLYREAYPEEAVA